METGPLANVLACEGKPGKVSVEFSLYVILDPCLFCCAINISELSSCMVCQRPIFTVEFKNF